MSNAEPWLRGPLEGIEPLVMPVFYTFEQVREELGQQLQGLTREQLWRSPGAASVGFHLKHIAGSVDRLTTYALGEQLSDDQMAVLKQESVPDESLDALLLRVLAALKRSEEKLRNINPATMYDKRVVGRRALPTTLLGLIVHIAEHTQRHLGQAITTAKVVRHQTSPSAA
ncbi:MAG: DinB family protein [Acidobacteriaceae bacterium]|nr:DinB family protein [Acidobacteriaceae bacterium]